MATSSDVVASWSVSLPDGIHSIKFEHGTTTGKRVVWVDNREILRKNWLFKLVGKIEFVVSNTKALITIDAISGFAYEYTLFINGKPLQKFKENRRKTAKVWTLLVDGVDTRVVLGKYVFLLFLSHSITKKKLSFVTFIVVYSILYYKFS